MDVSKIRDESFGELWEKIGTPTEVDGPLRQFATLQNNARGLVLDLGPGNGSQLGLFKPESIASIYGVEPSVALQKSLREAVSANGLSDKYHILSCGVEKESLIPTLKRTGLLGDGSPEIFDTITSSKVLCCVQKKKETVSGLYELLMPGGSIIMCEHIRNRWETPEGSIASRFIQVLFTLLGWPFLLGGCHLDRDTAQVVKAAGEKDGGWGFVNVDHITPWGVLPFAVGQFVKKS